MAQPRHFSIIYANGYGVPGDPHDQNYGRYLTRILRASLSPGFKTIFILAGGATNPGRPDMSEARYMLDRLTADHGPIIDRFTFRLLEDGRDVETNLCGLRRICKEFEFPVVTLYCEWARQDYFRFLAHQLIPNALVEPVIFDRGFDPRWDVRLKMLFFLPLRMLTWYWRNRLSAAHPVPARS